MGEPLMSSSRLGAELDADVKLALPPQTPALSVRVVEGLQVLALRHLGAGADDVQAAVVVQGVAALPGPGRCLGADPCVVWTGPGELLLLTRQAAVAGSVLRVLAAGRSPHACALDQSAAYVTFELSGPGLAALLPRLVDASALPYDPGQAGRLRWVDIGAVLLRLEAERLLLLVDRSQALYTAQWLSHGWEFPSR